MQGTASVPSARPVFVGGTQRSGTHALGHLLGRHSSLYMIPRELVVHCSPDGVQGFLRGEVEPAALVAALRGEWWKRAVPWDPEVSRGLYKLLDESEREAAVRAFEALAGQHRPRAARALVEALVEPMLARSGKPGWVEMSPPNVAAAGELATLFPEARFVHVVRDGRDVACSLVRLPWGASTLEAGLEHWASRLTEGDAAARCIGRRRVLVVELERLVLVDRERTYRELLAFLELAGEPAMRRFFEDEVTAERAHVGRWRAELTVDEQDRIAGQYRATLERLERAGVACLPSGHAIEPSFAPHAAERPNPFDPWSDGRAADA